MTDDELFNLVFDIGETMLTNGGEVDRTEGTLQRIAEAFEFEDFDCFVLVNGIFMTARTSEGKVLQAKVSDVTINPISLGRIDAINSLSRQIVVGECTPEEARQRIEEIKIEVFSSVPLQIFGYAMGCSAFCYIFGGSLIDAAGAFFLGFVISVYLIYVVPKTTLSKVFVNISGSMLISILAVMMEKVFPPFRLNTLIIGGVISLVPGVPIVMAIRYILNEDYTSGMVKLSDALATSLCIAVGVGVILKLFVGM